MTARYFVRDEASLGYVDDAQPDAFCPLASKPDGPFWIDGAVACRGSVLRPATFADFDAYRVEATGLRLQAKADGRTIIAHGGFNSGRLYTAEGQRIYWTLDADGWLFFNDRDRMIWGWIDSDFDADVLPNAPAIMDAYDRNAYAFIRPNQQERNPSPPADFDYGIKRRL